MDATIQTEQPEAAEVVAKVLAEEKKLRAENRSDHREPLVIPAQIYQPEFDISLNGFVRNISTDGVCLIAPQPYRLGAEVKISLFGQTSKLESSATCRWGTSFGDTYWLSGWQLSQQLPVGRLLKEDLLIEPEVRKERRVTTAIPVYIKLHGSSKRIPGFTRNLSRDGMCLVSKVETPRDQIASLDVMRLDGEASDIKSRCLWSKRYGDEYWVSGWGFDV